MNKKILFALLCGCACAPSFAQTYSGLDHINRIIQGTPGITTLAIPGGVSATASGAVNFTTASNASIAIPVAVEADVGFAAIALGGARIAARIVPWVGAALTVNAVWNAIKDSKYGPCPQNAQGACINPATGPAPGSSSQWPPYPDPGIYTLMGNGTYTLYQEVPSPPHGCVYTFPVGYHIANYRQTALVPCGWVAQIYVPSSVLPPATPDSNGEADVNSALGPKVQADSQLAKSLYDSEVATAQQSPNIATMGTYPLNVMDAPLKLVNSPPVTVPDRVTSTQTVTNPDGTTSTVTKTEHTTVTPTIAPGATVGNPQITFPSATTITTTTTNNTTNVTTSDTITQNFDGPASAAPAPVPLKMPTDYNRETTQQKVEADLNSDAAVAMPDQQAKVTAAQSDSDTKLQAMRDAANNDQGSNQSFFYRFVWTPPVGSCAPYTVGFRGYTGVVDMCSTVDNIRDVMGWLMALFTAFSVYGLLFKSTQD